MTVTNEKKEEICKKYPLYLTIIYELGNGVMLSHQLFELALALGLIKYKIDYWKILNDLKSYDIVRLEPFTVFDKKTQHQIIVLKKYAIRFLLKKEKSSDVAAVPKSNGNQRILLSIFKTAFILDKIVPAIQERGFIITWEIIIKYIKERNSSLFFNKNQGLSYLKIFAKVFPTAVYNNSEINADEETMQELLNSRKNAFAIGSFSTEGKGKGKMESFATKPLEFSIESYNKLVKKGNKEIIKSTKLRKLINYNFNSMLNSYTYVVQIVKNKDGFISISLLTYNLSNARDIYKIAQNVAAAYYMFKKYLDCKIILNVGIVCLDDVSQKLLEDEAEKKIHNKISKEYNEYGKLQEYLKLDGVMPMDLLNINVKFINYNLTNRYFDGIKHINILKSKGRPKNCSLN